MRKWTKNIVAASAVVAITAIASVAGGQATVSQAAGVAITQKTFKDSGVYAKAKSADKNNDGILSSAEAATVKDVYFYDETSDISATLKYFPKATEVTILSVPSSAKTITVNSTKIKKMTIATSKVVSIKGAAPTEVAIYGNGMKNSFDFSKATGYNKVKKFSFYGNETKKLVAPNQAKLTNLRVNGTTMTSYNTSKLKSIKELNLSNNKLKKLNVSKNKNLTSLACYSNKLSALNLSSNKKLKDVGAGDNNLKKIDVSKNKKITRVVVYRNKIKSLKYPKSNKIKEINVAANKLTKIEPKAFKSLISLDVTSNKISKLDVSKNTKLTYLSCADTSVKTLALSKMKKLTSLNVAQTSVTKLSLAKSAKLNFISVGKKYQLLKDVKMSSKGGNSVCMQLLPNKTYNLTTILPCLNGYEFSTYSQYVNLTPTGKTVFLGNFKKDNYLSAYATKGKTSVTISFNNAGVFY